MKTFTARWPFIKTSGIVLAAVLVFCSAWAIRESSALAAPKGPAGQTCKSSGTTTVNGKEEGTGKAMKCTADYCKYDECETSGDDETPIGNHGTADRWAHAGRSCLVGRATE